MFFYQIVGWRNWTIILLRLHCPHIPPKFPHQPHLIRPEAPPVVPSTNTAVNFVNDVTPKKSIEVSKSESKMVTKRRRRTKRWLSCQGHRADFCGTCLYFTNPRPESRTLCVVRRCQNKIVTEIQSKTNVKPKLGDAAKTHTTKSQFGNCV